MKKPCCRFYPTCSEYAIEAIEKYGAFKGFFMAVWRILRCNPFCKGGYDPVKLEGIVQTRYVELYCKTIWNINEIYL